ncbi:MAG: penicillin-binding transpeptidase domain-containing protein [Microbacteriaceae bacterium]
MNREMKRLGIVVIAMFMALFLSTSFIQVIYADELNNDARNSRTLYDSYNVERGSILVDGIPIASSSPVNSNYSFMRKYEFGELYAPITGYYTINQGITGLEAELNSYLSGTDSGRFLDRIQEIITGQPLQGGTVELTLDHEVQQAAWDALGDRKGAVVAYDPVTGKILALVSKPSYDPNLLTSHNSKEVIQNYETLLNDPDAPLINRAIGGDLYWPGSVFKLVVMAAALESGKYTANSVFPNPISYQLPNSSYEVRNGSRTTCGPGETVTLIEALRLSCNIPFVELGIELGPEALRAASESYGFGRELSIPLTVTPSSFPAELDAAQTGLVSFGQYDVKVTPMQMAMVSAAIANNGVQMKPYLVERILSPSLTLLSQTEPEAYSRPNTPAVAEELTRMMVNNVSNGIASGAAINGVDVAGKTGTAETGRPAIQHLWFTGFAPANNPKVAIAVVVEHNIVEQPSATSNSVAAPIAKKVMEAVLKQ